MGAERLNILYRKIVMFKKCPNGHRHRIIPNWKSEKNEIVIVDITQPQFQLRAGIGVLLAAGTL
jgi:hypothetical protein